MAPIDDPLPLFGTHLIALRKARNLSQESLALQSGLARSYVSGIERGKRNLSLVNICVLARALEVHPSEMLNFSGLNSEEVGSTSELPEGIQGL